jgi:hypothetical protein
LNRDGCYCGGGHFTSPEQLRPQCGIGSRPMRFSSSLSSFKLFRPNPLTAPSPLDPIS